MKFKEKLSYAEFYKIMKRIERDSYSSQKKPKPNSEPTQFSSMEEIDEFYDCSDYEIFRNDIHDRFGI